MPCTVPQHHYQQKVRFAPLLRSLLPLSQQPTHPPNPPGRLRLPQTNARALREDRFRQPQSRERAVAGRYRAIEAAVEGGDYEDSGGREVGFEFGERKDSGRAEYEGRQAC